MNRTDGPAGVSERPQLQIWDEAGHETGIGSFLDGEDRWDLVVVVEPIAADLVRGRLSFRSGDERYDTAAVLLEETPARVVQRGAELPHAMVHQLFQSARG